MQPTTGIVAQEPLFVKPALTQFAIEMYGDLYGCDPDSAQIGVSTMFEVCAGKTIETASLDEMKALVKHLAWLEMQAKLTAAQTMLGERVAA